MPPTLNTGTSVVDFLKSAGRDSSFSSRSTDAAKYGITGYTGSSQQNELLLSKYKADNASAPVTGPAPAVISPTPAVPTQPVNTVNAQDLSSGAFVPPPKTTVVAPAGLLGLAQTTQNNIDALTPVVAKGEEDINNTVDTIAGEESNRQNLYESEGVNTAKKELDDINNQMKAEQNSYQNKIDAVRNNNPTGQLEAGQTAQIDQLTKDHASLMADLSITAEAKQGNYTTAKSIVDAKVDAETAGLQTKLSNLQFFYQQNYGRLSDEQKTMIEEQAKNVDQQISDKATLVKDLGDIQIEAAQNGAPTSVIQAIGQSASREEAIGTAGKYIGLLSREDTLSTISARNKAAATAADGGTLFSKSAIANGAANAGVPLSTFQGLDQDTQNVFINGDLNGTKKTITDALSAGSSVDDVNKAIDEMGLPPKAAQYFKDFAAKNVPEDPATTIASTIADLQKQGYTRDEASQAVTDSLTGGGKSTLPGIMQTHIASGLDAAYGAPQSAASRFWNWLTVGTAPKKQ